MSVKIRHVRRKRSARLPFAPLWLRKLSECLYYLPHYLVEGMEESGNEGMPARIAKSVHVRAQTCDRNLHYCRRDARERNKVTICRCRENEKLKCSWAYQ